MSRSFWKGKVILLSSPFLTAPNFDKQFKLYVDASDVSAGAVLQQEDDQGIDHSVSYFSRKFEATQRRYSTIKKEILALLLALKHFDVHLNITAEPVLVYIDHNPIVFINKIREESTSVAVEPDFTVVQYTDQPYKRKRKCYCWCSL